MNTEFPDRRVVPLALPLPGPLTLGELLDRAFRLYRTHFGSLLMTAAIFLVPYGIISGLLTGNFMVSYMDFLTNMGSLENNNSSPDEVLNTMAPFMGFTGVFLLISLFGLLLQGFVTLSLTAQSLAILRGERLPMGESFRMSLPRLVTLVGKSIVQWLVIAAGTLVALLVFGCMVFGGAMTIGGLAYFFDGFASSDPSPLAMAGLVFLALIFYLLVLAFLAGPTLYFSARYFVATVGIMDQRWRAVDSLRQSWRLTKGLTRRSMGYVFLLFILISFVLGLPVAVAQNVVSLLLGAELLDGAMIGPVTAVFTALSTIMQVIWQPLSVTAAVLFYHELRIRQEDYDLQLRITQLEAERPHKNRLDRLGERQADRFTSALGV